LGVGNNDPVGGELYNKAEIAFRNAMESNPLHAASFCGFGCAVLNKDPLMAKNAFATISHDGDKLINDVSLQEFLKKIGIDEMSSSIYGQKIRQPT
jgi:hypothetical protein